MHFLQLQAFAAKTQKQRELHYNTTNTQSSFCTLFSVEFVSLHCFHT